ncbi:MAG: CHAT domain-containing protein [Cyclobacteriaceae bacterium]
MPFYKILPNRVLAGVVFGLLTLFLSVACTGRLLAGDQDDSVRAIQAEASTWVNKRLYKEAYTALKRAESMLGEQSDALKIRNDLLLSKLFMYQQEAEAAIQYGKSAYDLASRLDLDTLILESNLAIGEAIYYADGNAYSAIYYFEEAEQALNSYPYTVEIKYRTYYNLLVCNRAMGKIDNALQYGIRLEHLIKTSNGGLGKSAIANCYYIIGRNYLEMYSPKALQYFLKADSIMESTAGKANYYRLNYYYPQVAMYYNQQKKHQIALDYLTQIQVLDKDADRTNAQNIFDQSWTYMYLKQYQKAEDKASDYLHLSNTRSDSVLAYKTLGKIALNKGQAEKACSLLKKAVLLLYPEQQTNDFIPNVDEMMDPYNEPDIYGILGSSYLALGQEKNNPHYFKKAHQYLWFALNGALFNRPIVRHHNAQVTLTRHIKEAYSSLLNYYYHHYQQSNSMAYVDTAAMLINHSKASIIKSNTQLFQSASVPDSLKVSRNSLLTRINELQRKGAAADSIFDYFFKLEKIDAQISQIQQIYEEPVFQELPRIDDESMYINYLWGEDAIHIVTDGRIKGFYRLTNLDKIDSLTQLFYSRVSKLSYNDFNSFQHQGYSLYKEILDPVLPDTLPESIVIIPDEKLLLIPFEALLMTNGGVSYFNADYLIRHMDISYSPYLKMPTTNGDFESEDVAISFAYNSQEETSLPGYLKNAEEEARSVQAAFGGSISIGKEASETNYKSVNATARIQHLAVHGTAQEEIPYLAFRNEEDFENDGQLYEYEIFNMRIPAELVILSACESNMGEIASSEGTISLSRAFLAAGTASVISSLWTLNDDAAIEIFQRFLASYRNGNIPSAALSDAKRIYLANTDEIKAHPYFWAGLIANISKLPGQPDDEDHFHTILAVLSIIIIVSVYVVYLSKDANVGNCPRHESDNRHPHDY